MIKEQVAIYTHQDAREIHRRVLGSKRLSALGNPVSNQQEPDCYYAIALTDFAPATNPLTGYTTVQVQPLKYSGTTLDMVETTGTVNELTAVVRSRNCYGTSGTLLIIKKIGVEWGVIWVDCPDFPSSSLSGVTPDPSIESSETPPPPP